MSNRALLVIALVALGACVWFYFDKDKPGTAAAQERARNLLDLRADQVDRFELTNPSGTYVFVRTAAGDWEMEAPLVYPANASNVGTMLSDLEFAQRHGVVRRGGEPDFEELLPKFGLAEPRIRARMVRGKNVSVLAIGSQTARSGIFYGLVEDRRGREIVLVDRVLENQLQEGMDYWRSPDLLAFKPSEVTAVIARENGREAEMRKVDGVWRVVRPLDLAADPARAMRYLNDLRNLRAEAFVAEAGADLSAFGFSPPSGTIEVVAPDGGQTLILGGAVPGEAGQRYARPPGRDNVVAVSADAARGLFDLLSQVRPRNVWDWPPGIMPVALEVARGNENFRLVRGDGVPGLWRLEVEGWSGDVEGPRVESLLMMLRALEALEFLESKDNPNPAYGLARPGMTLTLDFTGNPDLPTPQTVRFGAARQGEVYAESSLQPFIVTVSQGVVDSLPRNPWEVLGTTVKVGPAEEITRVVWQGGGPAMTVEKDAEGKWVATGPKEPFDEMFFIQQTEMLSQLQAVEWLGRPGPRDFARPQLTLIVGVGDGEKRLQFGNRRGDGTVPVRVEGEPFVFTIPAETFQAIALRPVTQAPPKP